LDTPSCCDQGKCIKKNQWWASCQEQCPFPDGQLDPYDNQPWSCDVVGIKGCDTVLAEGEKCLENPDCCGAGACFEKNQWWAVCGKECPFPYGKLDTYDNQLWSCNVLGGEPVISPPERGADVSIDYQNAKIAREHVYQATHAGMSDQQKLDYHAETRRMEHNYQKTKQEVETKEHKKQQHQLVCEESTGAVDEDKLLMERRHEREREMLHQHFSGGYEMQAYKIKLEQRQQKEKAWLQKQIQLTKYCVLRKLEL
jgi:hypothetical protein